MISAQEQSAEPCDENQNEVCCSGVVDPIDPSIQQELTNANVSPSSLSGLVGTNCVDSGGNSNCPASSTLSAVIFGHPQLWSTMGITLVVHLKHLNKLKKTWTSLLDN
ncbi:uncharacterized protein N7496_001387 [Penicillium cataractarum]|uniref:Uncharacterized protein n=1 Tax=Penicillium cataractarum TaxID=2100454 RepID=A0A9X0B6T4_9EURO|nr:uncharacterized protein N7496_001387 [Penicillium cataractarum]KAJ5390319.1 hypothetical protein N7496_001387 [Penicillium cataractarum]